MSEFEVVLEEFEAALSAQEREAAKPSRVSQMVRLGVERALSATFLNADLGVYYNGTAEDQIVFQLKEQLFRKRRLPGYFKLTRLVWPDFGTVVAPTFLGVPWTPRKNQEPWASGKPPIQSRKDLEGRPLPDFLTAGLMPLVLKIHRRMKEILPPTFEVMFPGWSRGPLGNAFYLAGAEEVLTAMYTDPQYFHALMRYGMTVMKKYIEDRAAYLGEPNTSGVDMFNDEIAAENFSPQMYRDLIAPYDREYFEFFGVKVGFHSCGNTTPLMKEISAVADWSYFHVSPWSSLDEALRVFPKTPLRICLHPYRDVLGCPLDDSRRKIQEIADKCGQHEYQLGIDALLPVNGPAKDLQRINDVWKLCEDILA